MRLLFDDTSNRASDAGLTVPETDQELFSDTPESVYNPYQSSEDGSDASTTPDLPAQSEKDRKIKQAQRNMKRNPRDPDRMDAKKELWNRKARKYVKDEITDKVGNEALKAGMKKGLSKSAGKVGKEGAKKAGKAIAEKVGKSVAKKGAEELVSKGIGTAVGAATGIETFGVGFLLGFLINVAISLGINDVVESFEIALSDPMHAKFLAIRAGAKVGVFIYFLLTIVFTISVAGIFIAVILLFWLNVYMLCGFVFKKWAVFQGLVWWEQVVVVIIDIIAFLILMAFIGSLGYYLCGAGTVSDTVIGTAAAIYDWWNKGTAGSVAADFCKYINAAAVPAP